MVKIWFVRDGSDPTTVGPAYQLPLDDCVKVLGLSPDQFFSPLERPPRFGDQIRGAGRIAGFRHVVCEIQVTTAATSKWKAGYYRTQLSPEEAIERLGPPEEPWATSLR